MMQAEIIITKTEGDDKEKIENDAHILDQKNESNELNEQIEQNEENKLDELINWKNQLPNNKYHLVCFCQQSGDILPFEVQYKICYDVRLQIYRQEGKWQNQLIVKQLEKDLRKFLWPPFFKYMKQEQCLTIEFIKIFEIMADRRQFIINQLNNNGFGLEIKEKNYPKIQYPSFVHFKGMARWMDQFQILSQDALKALNQIDTIWMYRLRNFISEIYQELKVFFDLFKCFDQSKGQVINIYGKNKDKSKLFQDLLEGLFIMAQEETTVEFQDKIIYFEPTPTEIENNKLKRIVISYLTKELDFYQQSLIKKNLEGGYDLCPLKRRGLQNSPKLVILLSEEAICLRKSPHFANIKFLDFQVERIINLEVAYDYQFLKHYMNTLIFETGIRLQHYIWSVIVTGIECPEFLRKQELYYKRYFEGKNYPTHQVKNLEWQGETELQEVKPTKPPIIEEITPQILMQLLPQPQPKPEQCETIVVEEFKKPYAEELLAICYCKQGRPINWETQLIIAIEFKEYSQIKYQALQSRLNKYDWPLELNYLANEPCLSLALIKLFIQQPTLREFIYKNLLKIKKDDNSLAQFFSMIPDTVQQLQNCSFHLEQFKFFPKNTINMILSINSIWIRELKKFINQFSLTFQLLIELLQQKVTKSTVVNIVEGSDITVEILKDFQNFITFSSSTTVCYLKVARYYNVYREIRSYQYEDKILLIQTQLTLEKPKDFEIQYIKFDEDIPTFENYRYLKNYLSLLMNKQMTSLTIFTLAFSIIFMKIPLNLNSDEQFHHIVNKNDLLIKKIIQRKQPTQVQKKIRKEAREEDEEIEVQFSTQRKIIKIVD